MHVYKLCRICLTEGSNTATMQPLFKENDEKCGEIVQRIELCGGIVLKPHEEFPRLICKLCLDKLNVSYKFRSMCQASEHTLLDAIVKSEMKSEPIDYELSRDEDADNDNEVFFDMHTEFIDAQEIHLDNLTETIEEEILESDMEPAEEGVEEFIEYTDSENLEDDSPDETIMRASTSLLAGVQVKKEPKDSENTIHKNIRPKTNKERVNLKTELNQGKKSNRGRKKKDEELPNIMCEICGNIYPKRSLLNMHMRRHMAEKPYPCEICGKTFACPSEISRHMRVHTGEKPYVCKFCGRTFADRSTNIKHERIHTNERPFKCQTCGKSFTYSNVLKNHMLTHTGEKPFPCVPCNKTFSRKHQLDQHIATITHQQTVRNLTAADAKVQQIIEDMESKQHIANITQQQINRGIKIAHVLQQQHQQEEVSLNNEEVDVKSTHFIQSRQHHNSDVYISSE